MNTHTTPHAHWMDRHNGYHDFVIDHGEPELMLGMVDTTISSRVRSFVRRANGTWKLEDHASLEAAKQAVESLAQD